MTHTHCDFCGQEIPKATTDVYLVEVNAPSGQASLKKDACVECGTTARRILSLVDAKQLKQILAVTLR